MSQKIEYIDLKNLKNYDETVKRRLSKKQDKIDNSNKLNSDLVDDANATNKFVSASEKEQITTNQNAISGILDGTTLDSFSDVETALAGKQEKED